METSYLGNFSIMPFLLLTHLFHLPLHILLVPLLLLSGVLLLPLKLLVVSVLLESSSIRKGLNLRCMQIIRRLGCGDVVHFSLGLFLIQLFQLRLMRQIQSLENVGVLVLTALHAVLVFGVSPLDFICV